MAPKCLSCALPSWPRDESPVVDAVEQRLEVAPKNRRRIARICAAPPADEPVADDCGYRRRDRSRLRASRRRCPQRLRSVTSSLPRHGASPGMAALPTSSTYPTKPGRRQDYPTAYVLKRGNLREPVESLLASRNFQPPGAFGLRDAGGAVVRHRCALDLQIAELFCKMAVIDIAGRKIGAGSLLQSLRSWSESHGSVELACRLIDAAVEAGADAVKFQTFSAEDLVTETAADGGLSRTGLGLVGIAI